MSHDTHLTYTIEDDGVHLTCNECPFDLTLGFYATPRQAAEVERLHQAHPEARDPRPRNDCPYCGPEWPCRGSARTASGRDVEAFEQAHNPTTGRRPGRTEGEQS